MGSTWLVKSVKNPESDVPTSELCPSLFPYCASGKLTRAAPTMTTASRCDRQRRADAVICERKENFPRGLQHTFCLALLDRLSHLPSPGKGTGITLETNQTRSGTSSFLSSIVWETGGCLNKQGPLGRMKN
jgi:hypothetical protein